MAVADVGAVDALLDGIDIPKTVAELGLLEDRLDWLAEQGLGASRLVLNNPRHLNQQSMTDIARAACIGDRTIATSEVPTTHL